MGAPSHAGVPKEKEALESLAVVCGGFQKHLLSYSVGIVAPLAGREDAKLLPVGHAPNLRRGLPNKLSRIFVRRCLTQILSDAGRSVDHRAVSDVGPAGGTRPDCTVFPDPMPQSASLCAFFGLCYNSGRLSQSYLSEEAWSDDAVGDIIERFLKIESRSRE